MERPELEKIPFMSHGRLTTAISLITFLPAQYFFSVV
jgi:hypothetical protein